LNNVVLKIGGNDQYSSYGNGTIDEVRIYNRALSETEIQDQFSATKARLDYADLRFTANASIYKLPLTVSGHTENLTGYQVLVEVTDPAVISHIAKEDAGDLRFFESETNDPYSETVGKLPYWIEEFDTGSNTLKVWVKTNLTVSTAKDIYMYYGNSGAVSGSDGSAVFELFDDFEENVADQLPADWSQLGGTWKVEQDGLVKVLSGQTANSAAWNDSVVVSDFILDSRVKVISGPYDSGIAFRVRDGLNFYGTSFPGPHSERNYTNRVMAGSLAELVYSGFLTGNNEFHDIKLVVNGSHSVWYKDGLQASETNSLTDWSSGKIGAYLWRNGSHIHIDFIKVRKYVLLEPTITVNQESVFSTNSEFALNHWMENDNLIWVKVPGIPANGSVDVFMYYGNPGAESTSDGVVTFDFFDDFDGTNLDTSKWVKELHGTGSAVIVGNGQLKLQVGSGSMGTGVKSVQTFVKGFSVRVKRYSKGDRYMNLALGANVCCYPDGWWWITLQRAYGWETDGGVGMVAKRTNVSSCGTAWRQSIGTIGLASEFQTYNVHDHIFDAEGYIRWAFNDDLKGSIQDASYLDDNKHVLLAQGHYSGGWGGHQYVDWVSIRKYVFPEPVATVNFQQQVNAPAVNNISFSAPVFEIGDTVEATATATDPNNDPIIQFDFRVLDGLGNEVLNPSVQGSGFYSFTAVGEPGLWQIKVKASDGTYWSSEFTEVVFVNDPGLATVGLGLSDGIYSSTELVDGSVVLSGTQSSGSFITPAIDPVNFSKWGVVTFSKTTPGNSTLTVDVLKASDDSILISDIQNGQNISESIGDIPIKLGANFTSGSTPSLDSWDVSYYSQFKITVTDCSAPYSGDVTAEAVRVSDSEEFGPFTGTGGQVFVEVPLGVYNIQACIPANEKCSWKYNVELA